VKRRVSLLVASALLLAAAGAADWLVLHDGSRVETLGPWEERGPLVVFTVPNGALSSIRLSEVDLAASRTLTEEVLAEPVAAPSPPRRAALVITDADITNRVDPESLPDWQRGSGDYDWSEPPAGQEAEAPAAQEAAPRLQVVDWTEANEAAFDGTVIRGTLANTSSELTASIHLAVTLLDREGEPLASVQAALAARTLRPGQSTMFTARFPQILGYGTVQFEQQHTALSYQESGSATN
jgi:hypothetical protein